EILDREHLAEHRLQAFVATPRIGLFQLQELVVGGALYLDEVRHVRDLLDLAEILAKAFASGEGEGHSCRSFTAVRPFCPGWEPAVSNQWQMPPAPPAGWRRWGGG